MTNRFESRSHFWDSLLTFILVVSLFIKRAHGWLLEISLKKANKLIKLVKSWRDWYWKVPLTGIVTFAILFFGFGHLATSIFLAVFAAYLVLGPYVLNTGDYTKATKFCDVNLKIAETSFFVSLVGIIANHGLWISGEFWQVFSWPLLVTSLILFIFSAAGDVGIALTLSEEAYYEIEGLS
jgi:hypothetical protein